MWAPYLRIRLPSNLRNYRSAALEFVREAGDPRRASAQDVGRWRRAIEQVRKGPALVRAAASTVNVKIVAVRALFQFLRARGDRNDNPAADLKLRRGDPRLPQPIPEADVVKILAAANAPGEGRLWLQARAIVELYLGGGLRGSEVALLRLGWVEDREFLRVTGKRRKIRNVPISDAAVEALRDWSLAYHGDEEARRPRRGSARTPRSSTSASATGSGACS